MTNEWSEEDLRQLKALRQLFLQTITEQNPDIPDVVLLESLGLPKGDIRLLSRARSNPERFPLKHLARAVASAEALNGKMLPAGRGGKRRAAFRWDPPPAPWHVLKRIGQRKAEAELVPIIHAVNELRRAYWAVYNQMRSLAHRLAKADTSRDVRLFMRVPDLEPPHDLLEIPRVHRKVKTRDGEIEVEDFAMEDFRITGVPVMAWVDGRWVTLDADWTPGMIDTPRVLLRECPQWLQQPPRVLRNARLRALAEAAAGDPDMQEAGAHERVLEKHGPYTDETPESLFDPDPVGPQWPAELDDAAVSSHGSAPSVSSTAASGRRPRKGAASARKRSQC